MKALHTSTSGIRDKKLLLVLAVLFDFIGYATYSIPALGEFGDLFWAPIAGALNYAMFGGMVGAMGGAFTFIEEILPMTDFIPSFTLTWLFVYYFKKSRNTEVERFS